LTQADELRIIKKVIKGDNNAFEELVLENQKKVYNLALKMTGNEDDALDISQEAFFKAYTQLNNFRGESHFSVWMYRLTYNLCIDFLRKKPKAQVISLTSHDDNCAEDMEIPDTRELPENEVLSRETRKAIADSIDTLGSSHREILIMREITGMSYSDIAITLNVSEGTVKSRLARARKNLAGILIDKGTFPESFRQKEREEVEERGYLQ